MPQPKKTIEAHQANGSFRPGRHAGPRLPVELPPLPPDLTPTAQACWNVVAENLRQSGCVSAVDGKALRLLCESWAIYVEAGDEIRARGLVVEEITGHGGSRLKANPAVAIRAKAWVELVKLLVQFGLTPASRTGLYVGGGGAKTATERDVAAILQLRPA